MKIYGLKACDACRKAAKATGGTLIDIRAEPLSEAQLKRFLAAFGEALVNRRSTTWREMTEDQRAGEPLELLQTHPTLMKRPVIEDGETLHLGFGKDVQGALGLG